MSFYLFTFEDEYTTPNKSPKTAIKNITSPNNVPLFFIPGIFGHNDFQHIIKALRKSGDTRDIYVYYHPAFLKETGNESEEEYSSDNVAEEAKDPASLLEYIDEIVYDIKDCLPKTAFPSFLIVGYSYGCNLATLVAEKLTEENLLAYAYLIDGPSPEVNSQYFTQAVSNLAFDFEKIIRVAASYALADSFNDFKLTPCSKDDLPLPSIDDSPSTYFLNLATFLKNKYEHEGALELNTEIYETNINNAADALRFMTEYQGPTKKNKLDQIFYLPTNETTEKYKNTYGGWDAYAKKLFLVDDSDLKNTDHLELLSERVAPKIAASIKNFITTVITPDTLFQYYHHYLQKDYCKSLGFNAPSDIEEQHCIEGQHNTHIENVKIDISPQSSPPILRDNNEINLKTINIFEKIIDSTNKQLQYLKKNKTPPDRIEDNNIMSFNRMNFFTAGDYKKEQGEVKRNVKLKIK